MQYTKTTSHKSRDLTYIYDSLKKDRTIRLLTLTSGPDDVALACTLDTVLLDDCPPYDALSYVWGNTTERHPLLCMGKTLMITQNLYSVLLQFSHEGHTDPLWVDAVCINQEDLGERSKQVSFMGDIYANARCTLVWLGPPSDNDYQAFEVTDWLINTARSLSESESDSDYSPLDFSAIGMRFIASESLVQYDENKTKVVQLAQLLTRPWFQRVWIIQEVAKAKEVTMLHGNRSTSFRSLLTAVQILVDCGLEAHSGVDIDMHAAHRSGYHNMSWLYLIRTSVTANKMEKLFQLVNVARSFESTDPRDKLYALLGMALSSDTLRVESDYTKAPCEVFREFAIMDIIHHRQLRMLSCASYRDSCRSSYDLPSWIPDWSVQSESNSFLGFLSYNFNVAKETCVDATLSNDLRVLRVHGKLVSLVSKVTTRSIFRPRIVEHDSADSLKLIAAAQFYANSLAWLKECLDVSFGPDCLSPDIFGSSSWETFSRTLLLLCRPEHPFLELEGDVKNVVQEIMKTVDLSRATHQDFVDWEIWGTDSANIQTFVKTTTTLLRACSPHAKGRNFCRTDKGHLGWVPADAKEGDCVCMLFGGQVFYVLRPDGHEHYQLIGECYLHGLMQGEGMDKLGVDDRQFHIR